MADDSRHEKPPSSPFYCLPVNVAPEEGRQRILWARLQELKSRNAWLVRLRWLAATGLVAAATAARFLFGLHVDVMLLYLVAAFLLVYNVAFFFLVSRRPAPADAERGLRRATFLAVLQIVTDLAALTVALHASGGIENPFFFYFVFHMIIGSILLSRGASFYIATLATVLFFGLALGEYAGIISHHELWPDGGRLYANGLWVLGVLVVFVSTMYLSVYFAGNVVLRLRARDEEMVSVTSSLEKGSLQLAEAYEKIRALEEKKSEFMRTVSHQLRSPLAGIKSLLDVVLDGYAEDAERQKDMLERARSRTSLMLAMVNDLLSLSRLKDAADIQAHPGERVNVCELVAELEALYRPRAQEKGLTLAVQPPPDRCLILASPNDVREALNNLVDNAINYTPPGGRVALSASVEKGRLAIGVSDTGIGIPGDSLARVFEEFYRAPNAKSIQALGTGLGLAVVKRAVEKWNGTVAVDSEVGRGTTFTVEFPVAPVPGQA